jgi:hypothetical protein
MWRPHILRADFLPINFLNSKIVNSGNQLSSLDAVWELFGGIFLTVYCCLYFVGFEEIIEF